MKSRRTRYHNIEELRQAFVEQRGIILARLHEFAATKPEDYYYELAYCLLTPQSSASHAAAVVVQLRAANFQNRSIEPTAFLCRKSHYIRFHNTKARRLLEAKDHFPHIAAALANGGTSSELREWLVRHVKGLGWKEASHFLRNIGHRRLAILDRHILKNLKHYGVVRSIPKSLTPRRYLAIEAKFAAFATDVGISMDELDLLFWSKETGIVLK
jgi:N-glycosylase/DNA lyase